MAQWKRAGLITPMSHDRNMSLLFLFRWLSWTKRGTSNPETAGSSPARNTTPGSHNSVGQSVRLLQTNAKHSDESHGTRSVHRKVVGSNPTGSDIITHKSSHSDLCIIKLNERVYN